MACAAPNAYSYPTNDTLAIWTSTKQQPNNLIVTTAMLVYPVTWYSWVRR